MTFQVEDAEDLSFPDEAFDVVLSTFDVMFTADHDRAAAEMVRVCRRGGVIGMANWTPQGFIGEVFRTVGRHVPPPPGARSPALWGTEGAVRAMFGPCASDLALHPQQFVFRYASVDHFIEFFRTWYGPVHRAFAVLGGSAGALEADLRDVLERRNLALDGTLVVPSEYLEVVIRRK